MADWDAGAYHRLSDPQFRWGLVVLERLRPLRAELILDVGCGSGRLTAELAARARVIAIDRSAAMLAEARALLPGVPLVRASADALPFENCADAIFSTATFHWVLDHDALVRSLFGALKSGGRLVAQCGGGPNLEKFFACLRRQPEWPQIADVRVWHFAAPEETAQRMRAVGFAEVETSSEPAPSPLGDRDTYREFVRGIILRDHLPRLENPDRLLDALADESDDYTLDYWRLNLSGVKP